MNAAAKRTVFLVSFAIILVCLMVINGLILQVRDILNFGPVTNVAGQGLVAVAEQAPLVLTEGSSQHLAVYKTADELTPDEVVAGQFVDGTTTQEDYVYDYGYDYDYDSDYDYNYDYGYDYDYDYGDTYSDYDYGYEELAVPSYDGSGHVNANVSGAWIAGSDFVLQGVHYDDSGYSYTYYSENVLPGGGLTIPGRHVNDEGYVVDGNGNICIASDDLPYGTVVDVPFGDGTAVVYDCGSGYGNLDIYVSW